MKLEMATALVQHYANGIAERTYGHGLILPQLADRVSLYVAGLSRHIPSTD